MLNIRATEDDIGPQASSILSAWIFFQIAAGHVLLPILAATLLLSRPKRTPLVTNVCITWIITSIISSLLFYVGEHVGPEPSRGLCVAQASLMDAVPMMTSTALLSLTYHVWYSFDSGKTAEKPRMRKGVLVLLMFVPYVMLALFFGVAYQIANTHPDDVNRAQQYFYCSLSHRPLLMKYGSMLRRRSCTVVIETDLFARSMVFGVYLTTANVFRLVGIWRLRNALPDMFFASVEMVLFLALITHRPTIQTWCFWRRRHASNWSTPTITHQHNSGTGSLVLPTLGWSRDGSRTVASSTISDSASSKIHKDGFSHREHRTSPSTLASNPPNPNSNTNSPNLNDNDNEPSLRQYFESRSVRSKPNNGNGKGGVEIIGKPEEAFGKSVGTMSVAGHGGVEIIGRPEEAFNQLHVGGERATCGEVPEGRERNLFERDEACLTNTRDEFDSRVELAFWLGSGS
ncbi:hypothetical protein NLI96_g1259 [Meripilus lineatus]|uniref:Uncharacterized protein n=1 Tax=Meripilus lineatus TaxID=2056292 RepID=A0AAD5YN47_9APHY|nr:hypothetical protein NLI96_g1259 [Physisporinus lineatus]